MSVEVLCESGPCNKRVHNYMKANKPLQYLYQVTKLLTSNPGALGRYTMFDSPDCQ